MRSVALSCFFLFFCLDSFFWFCFSVCISVDLSISVYSLLYGVITSYIALLFIICIHIEFLFFFFGRGWGEKNENLIFCLFFIIHTHSILDIQLFCIIVYILLFLPIIKNNSFNNLFLFIFHYHFSKFFLRLIFFLFFFLHFFLSFYFSSSSSGFSVLQTPSSFHRSWQEFDQNPSSCSADAQSQSKSNFENLRECYVKFSDLFACRRRTWFRRRS